MKNLLLKKSFLRVSLFVLVFGFVFAGCNPGGGNADVAAFLYYKENGVEKLATTFVFSVPTGGTPFSLQRYTGGKLITKVKMKKDNSISNQLAVDWTGRLLISLEQPSPDDVCSLKTNNEECTNSGSSKVIIYILRSPN